MISYKNLTIWSNSEEAVENLGDDANLEIEVKQCKNERLYKLKSL